MRRRLLAATTTLALVAGPAAAFAQEPEPVPDEPVEEASSLEDLAQALEVWADEMADSIEALLSDLMAQLAFSRMEADALAEVGDSRPRSPWTARTRGRTTARSARRSPPWRSAPARAASGPWSTAWPTTVST